MGMKISIPGNVVSLLKLDHGGQGLLGLWTKGNFTNTKSSAIPLFPVGKHSETLSQQKPINNSQELNIESSEEYIKV